MTPPFPNKLSDCAPPRHLLVAVLVVAAACGDSEGKAAPSPGTRQSAEQLASDSARAMAAVRDPATSHRLSPAADSLTPYLVFIPHEERVLVAASRLKQMLLDVGRMDVDVRKDTTRQRLFREAARVLSPIPEKSVIRLAWAEGSEDVVADSFAVYNGRIVMRLFGSAALDTAARGKATVVALATRADSALPPVASACELRIRPDSAALAAEAALAPAERRAQGAARKTADSAYDARVAFVRDSLEQELRKERPVYERLQRRMKFASSQVRGCFGPARRALVASLRAGDAEWVRERLVLVAPDGSLTVLRVNDLRFRAHDLITAFDADGDGVDDLATRATTERAGGTSVLRLDLAKKRADRVAAGFAWEQF
ncbi:MAG: hypothetical protein ACYC3L_09040 [Gemmatimonadaceae bacterium]